MLFAVMLSGCNSMYIKPNSMDMTQVFYADRGGYSMRRSIKNNMRDRDVKIVVGKSTGTKFLDGDSIELDTSNTMNARYIVKVSERREKFIPWWCMFNGFWWWNFNVSIADQQNGEELFTWRGRGCANSSLRKLDDALDQLEINQTISENKNY